MIGKSVGRPARALLTTGILVLAAAPLHAQGTIAPDSTGGGKPALVRTSDLIYAGLYVGTLALLRPLEGLDEGLRPDSPPTGAAKTFADVGDVAGNSILLYGGSAATWGLGELIGDRTVARVGLRALGSLVVTSVLIYTTKVVVGRRRPREDGVGSTEFDMFNLDEEYQSFPSGHAAHSFAVASAVAGELGDQAPWVPFVAYPVAGLIGASRVVGRDHWFTDVVAGSAAGLFAGQLVGRWDARRSATKTAAPELSVGFGPDGALLLVHLSVN